jgi:hypothetical protein
LLSSTTACHVVVDKNISITPRGQAKTNLTVTSEDIEKHEALTDLVYIHTTIHPLCSIPLGESKTAGSGDHLLSIGFPGIDYGNPILYEGFLSGRFPHPPTAALAVINGKPLIPKYEIFKVQMPITPGASGSPIIDDSGKAIGVVSEVPVIWTQDLEKLTQVRNWNATMSVGGFDALKLLQQLSIVVREFDSPGSGYAVPLSYLKTTRGEVAPPVPSSH